MKKYRTVALISREPGLRVLQDVLLSHPRLDLAGVLTHRLKAKREGGGERPDFPGFVATCEKAGIPLRPMDWAEARQDLAGGLPEGPLDLMIVLSWRSIIPAEVIARMPLGGINIHRGALPDYAGDLPIERAIEAGEKRVAITALDLASSVDAGDALAVAWMGMPPRPAGAGIDDHAETVKSRLVPFYAPLTRLAIDLRIADFEMERL